MENNNNILFKGTAFIVGIYFFFLCLVQGKPFLVTLVMAVILALLMVPFSNKLEKWGLPRGYSSLANTLFLLALSIGFAALVSFQLSEFLSDWHKVEKKVMPMVEKVWEMIHETTPLKAEDIKLEDPMSPESLGKGALTFVKSFYSFLGDYLLTFIYLFFLLNYRSKFRQFFIKLFPNNKHKEVSDVLNETANITQEYLFGKSIMVIFLVILYSVGMGLTGVDNFIVISIIAALLTVIPYIGNIVGFMLAIGLGYITNGDTTALIGIIVTFTLGQFLESYILEPYVVGDKVNLDPMMTILAVVAGGLIWGVAGMILSVPLLAIANIAFSHVKPLKPISFLLSSIHKKEK